MQMRSNMIRLLQRTAMCIAALGALATQVQAATLNVADLLQGVGNITTEIDSPNPLAVNNSLANAQDINGAFSLDFVASGIIADIYNTNTSGTIPHATIVATGNGTFDYFSFDVILNPISNPLGIFDIDYGNTSEKAGGQIDTVLALFDSEGKVLAYNDDRIRNAAQYFDTGYAILNPADYAPPTAGYFPQEHDASPSSVYAPFFDPFIQYRFTKSGTYYIGVGKVDGNRDTDVGDGNYFNHTGGLTGLALPECTDYVLHVSIENHSTIPEPTSMAIFGIGACCMGIGALRRRRKEKQAGTV
ncbi:MAG: hypothetical protein COA78_03530 [Blastopirellula sp.]|nr:MAG: hypothetical protein COA78_03530 [Blastopirellula sp.]